MKLAITLRSSELANQLALTATQYGDNLLGTLYGNSSDDCTLVNSDQWVTRKEVETIEDLLPGNSSATMVADWAKGMEGIYGRHKCDIMSQMVTNHSRSGGEFVVTVVPPAWEGDTDSVVAIGYQSFGGTSIVAMLPDNDHTICLFADGARSAIHMLLKDHFGFDVNNPEHVAAATVEWYESQYGGIGNATPYRLQWHESKWCKNPLDFVTVERYPATTLVGELLPRNVNGDLFLGRQAGVTDVLNGAAFNTNIAAGIKCLSEDQAKELSDILAQLEALELRSKVLIDQLVNKADE